MNPFAAVGLGQALGRGVGRRHLEARTRLVHEMMALIESEPRGSHPADASAELCIARLRAAATRSSTNQRRPAVGVRTLAILGD